MELNLSTRAGKGLIRVGPRPGCFVYDLSEFLGCIRHSNEGKPVVATLKLLLIWRSSPSRREHKLPSLAVQSGIEAVEGRSIGRSIFFTKLYRDSVVSGSATHRLVLLLLICWFLKSSVVIYN